MLQIIVTKSFNNPNLPISTIGSDLNLESSLATWELLDGYDYSGKGHNIALSGSGLSFDEIGLASTGVKGSYAETGLLETDSFSVIMAFNAAVPTLTSQVWSTLETSSSNTSYFRGCRQAVRVEGTLYSQAFAGDGNNANSANLTSGALTNTWEVYYFSVSATELRTIRGSTGGATSAAINNGRRKSVNPFRLCGGWQDPHDTGIVGHLGVMAVYDGVLGDTLAKQQISKAKAIMQRRGVTFSW